MCEYPQWSEQDMYCPNAKKIKASTCFCCFNESVSKAYVNYFKQLYINYKIKYNFLVQWFSPSLTRFQVQNWSKSVCLIFPDSLSHFNEVLYDISSYLNLIMFMWQWKLWNTRGKETLLATGPPHAWSLAQFEKTTYFKVCLNIVYFVENWKLITENSVVK